MINIRPLLLCIAFIICSLFHKVSAQETAPAHSVTVPEGNLSNEDVMAFLKKIPVDGWVLLQYKEGKQLINRSNKEYVLHLRLLCDKAQQQPGYLVEYSDAYGDGDYGGIDFISSRRSNGNEVHFLLDGKDYKDPFIPAAAAAFKTFAEALKKAQKLTISVYDNELNPETGKKERRLNRSIDFKTAHSELLEIPVSCGD